MQPRNLDSDTDPYDRLRSCAHTTGRLGVQLLLALGLVFPLSAVAAEPTDCDPEPQTTTAYYGEFLDGPNCAISSGDIDVFELHAKAGERIIVQVVDQSGSGFIAPCITLLDPFGVPTPNGDTTCADITARITEDIDDDGTYLILVEETDTGAFAYGLTVERLAPQPSPFAPIICNGCSEGDVINGGGDLDEHIFTGAAGDVVRVQATDLSGSGFITVCLTLYDNTGSPTANGLERCLDITASIDETLPADGVYIMLVRENDSGSMSYNVNYQCLVGTCPAFDSPTIVPSSSSVDFDQVEIGTSSPPVQVALTGSSGDIDAAIGEIALTGADATEFDVENDQCSHVTLSDGESCTFDVVFKPMTLGNLTATVDIVTNDVQNPLLTISLTGEGVDAPLVCGVLVVTIQGTGGADLLLGTAGADVIHGLGGDDVIYGLEGDDWICGGDGRDILLGGTGDDTLFGGGGPDVILSAAGNDRMRGGGGDDYLNGGGGDDILDGRGGVDLCDGGSDVNGDTGRSCETTLNIP